MDELLAWVADIVRGGGGQDNKLVAFQHSIMALDLTGSTNSPNTPNIKTLIGKNYDRKLTQSIQNLLSEIPKQSPKCSDFAEEFYEKMQARVDPHLESTWVYVALAFRS
ncbi:hypothetical protein EV2_032869 [Malus domestica]